jgi:large subunit ribosomal protein L17
MRALADSLVLHGSIETTLPKAKEVSPYVEKLITKAKKGDLHNRRQIITALMTEEAAHKLVDEIAPKLKDRNSGYLRVERTRARRGDNAQLARVSFVDDLTAAKPEGKATSDKPKTAAKKTPAKKSATTKAEDK